MAALPPPPQEVKEYRGCPYCTIQIPVDAAICPHCRKATPDSEKQLRAYPPKSSEFTDFRRRLHAGDGFARLSNLWTRYGKWIKVAGPVLAAIALLFLVYAVWVDYRVTVVPNPQLPLTVKKDKRERVDLLMVSVTNKGEDIPDLSLKSIGVVVEFAYHDGRRVRKTVFPKAEYRGEGAMLNGETGWYEISVSSQGLKEVILRSEVVDLGMGRKLIAPTGVKKRSPAERKAGGT